MILVQSKRIIFVILIQESFYEFQSENGSSLVQFMYPIYLKLDTIDQYDYVLDLMHNKKYNKLYCNKHNHSDKTS